MNLKCKNILVTGASSGIGQAIAVVLAQKGAIVLVNYRANKKGAQKTLEEVRKYSDGRIYKADLTKVADTKKMFGAIKRDVGGIDVLVNNAGDAKSGDIFDEKAWQGQHESILMTAVHATQEFLKIRSDSQRKIINITSLYGELASSNPEFMQYSAEKAALANLTVNLAKELGKNVLVNAISPGYTWTPPWGNISKKEKSRYEDATLIERFIRPDEIAHVAVMLAENDAITGQIIGVNGGSNLVKMNRHE